MVMISPPGAVTTDSLTWLRDDAEWAALRVRLRIEVEASPQPLPPIEELKTRGEYHFITPLPEESWECFHVRVRTEESLLSWLVARLTVNTTSSG